MKRKASTNTAKMSIEPTHVIDRDGELIIVLRNANSPFAYAAEDIVPEATSPKKRVQKTKKPNEFRIQVSAKHMSFASPFFQRTLTGGWKETETYLQKGFVEITAEDWDLEALLIILRAIHCQYNAIPPKVTLEMLAKVAVIADYYDCKDFIYIMTDKWIGSLDENLEDPVCSRGLILWLWVSWFFRLSTKFMEVTRLLIVDSDGLVNPRGLPTPAKIIDSINSLRLEVISNALSFIHETREAFLSGKKGCWFQCQAIMYGSLAKEIHLSPLLSPWPITPFRGLSCGNLSETVKKFRSPKWYDLNNVGHFTSFHKCAGSTFDELFSKLEEDDSIKGLDLDKFSPA